MRFFVIVNASLVVVAVALAAALVAHAAFASFRRWLHRGGRRRA